MLLHGLGRTARSMGALEHFLLGRRYIVLNLGYPSRRADVATLHGSFRDETEKR